MKVTLLTLGTRGDVQPYVAIAKELIKNGHEALVCTGASFRDFIEDNGVNFHGADTDFMSILESEEGRKVFQNGYTDIFKTLKFAKEVIAPSYRRSMDDFVEAANGSDILIFHPKALGAPDVAEYYGIPCVSMSPVPVIYPIKELPNLVIASKRNFGPTLNKLTYKATSMGEASYMKQINDFRINTLKLPKRKAGSRTFDINGRSIPVLYPVSPYLFREIESWKDRVFISGFFFMEQSETYLNEDLERFLESGNKPVVISFSSMPLKDPGGFMAKLKQALKDTGNRAVILTGVSGVVTGDDADLFTIDKAPHRLLFKRAKCIIHHGGVGTMSEALLSGVPQLMIPFTGDQPFWAHRLYAQGYALAPLKEKNLKTSDLVRAFREMEDSSVINNAKEIQNIIHEEKGLKNAVNYIIKVPGTEQKQK